MQISFRGYVAGANYSFNSSQSLRGLGREISFPISSPLYTKYKSEKATAQANKVSLMLLLLLLLQPPILHHRSTREKLKEKLIIRAALRWSTDLLNAITASFLSHKDGCAERTLCRLSAWVRVSQSIPLPFKLTQSFKAFLRSLDIRFNG